MTAQPGLAVSRDGSSNGTTPKAFRLAIGGILAKNGASGLDVRKGVLWDTGGAVVAGTGAMSYTVRSCNAVVMPSSTQGPVIVPNDASVTVTTTAAPGSNSRIDVIWVRQHLVAADGGADTDVIGEFGVTQGTAAASPSAPAIPTGAVELARATVTSGATATNTLTISQTHNWVVAAGAPIPVRNNTERSALTAFDGMMVHNLTNKRVERYNATTGTWMGTQVDEGAWVNVPVVSPFTTSTLQVRKVGQMVVMRGGVARASGVTTTFTTAAQLPTGYFPSADHPVGIGAPRVLSTVNVRGQILSATGEVQIAMSDANTGIMAVDTTWFLD